jgi:hypothetical protein
MPGIQPPQSAGEPPRTPPHTSKSIAAATTEMMWAVALATTRASVASTARGLALWSRMLRAPIGPWSLVADSSAVSAGGAAASGVSGPDTAAGGAEPAGIPVEEAAAFASYRSSGGHAAAQVVTHH